MSRDDRFALFALMAWICGATVARSYGIWIGVGGVAVLLGLAALLLDGAALVARRSSTADSVALGLVAGGAMAIATYALYPLVVALAPASAVEAHRLYAAFATVSRPRALALVLPIIVGEELVWRGVVQAAATRRVGRAGGVALAAALYALGHAAVGSPLLIVVAFGCGLVWSTLRAARGDLVAPLVAHAVWDVCVLVVWPLG